VSCTHLSNNLAELWSNVRDTSFSMVIRCSIADTTITSSEALAGPYIWQ
jgi:hypothetical protein